MTLQRRSWLAGVGAGAGSGLLGLAGCVREPAPPAPWTGGWVGADMARGHGLRDRSHPAPSSARTRRADVLVVGAGIAGLAAARALMRAGITDVQVLELEDSAGGNSRGHSMGGLACPLGAHYLPVPGPQAHEVSRWLHEIGVLRTTAGRTVADERHLCHSPQERLFFDGAWLDGLLPPAAQGSRRQQQYRQFGASVQQAQAEIGFALPSHRAGWSAAHQALDAQPFSQWLDQRGLDDPALRWYLDYACRDDYGAGAGTVSAWAGLHYFASRHGFHAPGDVGDAAAERDAVLTWPEGNAWLSRRLAEPLGERLRGASGVWRVSETVHEVQVRALDARSGRDESWVARAVVMAVPLFIAARLLQAPPPALAVAAQVMRYAPWLVANLHLDAPLLDRPGGAPPSWDNVRFGSPTLGYVDATHQSLRPLPGPTVLTAYWALPESRRKDLSGAAWRPWGQAFVDDLSVMHPDLPRRLQRIDLMRYGHAMAMPVPGLRSHPALAALAAPPAPGSGRVHFAHADLSGYSVFEEAFSHGHRAGSAVAAALRGGPAPRR